MRRESKNNDFCPAWARKNTEPGICENEHDFDLDGNYFTRAVLPIA